MSVFCEPPSNGVPLVSGCCTSGECLIYTATVLSGIRQQGFATTTAGVAVEQPDCRMWRTRRETLFYTSDGTKAWEVVRSYSHPGNQYTRTIVYTDGAFPAGDVPGGNDPVSVVSWTETSVRLSLSNGIVEPFELLLEVSDQITDAQILGSLALLIPDDALIETLSIDGTRYFHRTHLSDDTIDMQEKDGGQWQALWFNGQWQAFFPNTSFEDPWHTIAQRFQKLEGIFPNPTPPTPLYWGGMPDSAYFIDYYAADMRSRVKMTSGTGCFGRRVINNGNAAPCFITPVPDHILRFGVATPQLDFIMSTPNANETVAIQCGECPT